MKAISLCTRSALLLLMSACSLAAQGSERADEVRHRNDCRLATQVLHTGQPNTKREWALSYVQMCGTEGTAVLVEQWQSIGNGDPSLQHLVRVTPSIRDNRLYRKLSEVAADRSRPTEVRVGAMLVLSRYVDPMSAVWLTDLVPPDSIGRIRIVGASAVENVQVDGAQPIPGPVAAPVLALLERIAADRATEPREVWYAAAVLARRVRVDIDLGRAQ